MSGVARLLQEAGWTISGSDEGFYPPVSLQLERYGMDCLVGYRASNIPANTDLIVIGKHAKLVPEENEEVRAAFESGIPVKSFPEVLQDLCAETDNFVVAGSYGKSTCTALLASVLVHAGKDPSYFIGAVPLDLPDNAHHGAGSAFVLEGDEYPSANWDARPKFLFYHPHHLLLTSGEHDHINVYPTIESYLAPFKQLLALDEIRDLTACLDGEHVQELIVETQAPVHTYALENPAADWRAADMKPDGDFLSFTLLHHNEPVVTLKSLLLGRHNVQNIVGISAMLLEAGAVTADELAAGVAAFTGVRQRLERRTPTGGVPLYEDFGSSHAKLVAGIAAMREQFPDRRLTVLFEPHTFTFRNREAIAWYDDLFKGADRVLVFAPPSHGATDDQLTQAEIVDRVASTGIEAHPFGTKEELPDLLGPLDPNRDVLLVETSGGIGDSVPYLIDLLQK